MSALNLNKIVQNLSGESDNTKAGTTFDRLRASVNPYTKRNGELVNKYIDYQKVLDDPKVTSNAKRYITEATGLTQTKTESADGNGAYKGQNFSSPSGSLGFISAKYESGGNGGTVSSGAGDYGGVSYGVIQFSSAQGSADNYINYLRKANPEMASAFGNSKAGTAEFNNAWKQTYQKYGQAFTNSQNQYAYNTFVQPLIDLAYKKTGIDYSSTPALRELVFSTAIQFGGGSLGLSALGNVSAGMSERDIINASYDKKINNYKGYYKSSSADVQEGVRNRWINERNDVLALVGNSASTTTNTQSSGQYKAGQKVTNANYNNDAAKGQCVWYVRGRAKEKLGVNLPAMGNGNDMWYNAKPEAKLAANVNNIKPNTLISYQKGTSSAGQTYGHVIYIEDVVGDTVYYTEGGSGYYKNGTIGTVKTATKEQILNGVNSSGARIGSNAIGIIDLNKYR